MERSASGNGKGFAGSFPGRLVLILLQSLVIALLVAFAQPYADRLQTGWKLQERLYDDRLEAYAEIDRAAEEVMVRLSGVYGLYDELLKVSKELYPLEYRTRMLDDKLRSMLTGAARSTWTQTSAYQVVEALRGLLAKRDEHRLLVPRSLDERISDFARVVLNDVEELQAAAEKRQEQEGAEPSPATAVWAEKTMAKSEREKRWQQAEHSFSRLRQKLRKLLALDIALDEPFPLVESSE